MTMVLSDMDTDRDNLRLQRARQDEALFLWQVYSSLQMDRQRDAGHNNWFSSSPLHTMDVCTFSGIVCNNEGLVVVLDLSSKDLRGSLPSNFWPLTQLERLLLRNNLIGGKLPSQLPETLFHLNVDKNDFHGSIPSFQFPFKTMMIPQLQRLILSDNYFSGTLSDGLCSLYLLRDLNLSRNAALVGTLPACLTSLVDLKGVQVHRTSLVGPLPFEFCQPPLERPTRMEGNPDAASTVTTTTAYQVEEGWCARFQFCVEGYHHRVSLEAGSDGQDPAVSCQACDHPSNALSSSTCKWIPPLSIPSLGPSKTSSLALSLHPSTLEPSTPTTMMDTPYASDVPSDAPSLVPSWVTWPTIPGEGQFPSLRRPTNPPTQTIPILFPTSKRHTAGPSLVPSGVPTTASNNVGSMQGLTGNSATKSKDYDGDDQFVNMYLPILVLVCCLGVAVLVLAIPSFRHRRSRFFGFRSVPSETLRTASKVEDGPPPQPSSAPVDPDVKAEAPLVTGVTSTLPLGNHGTPSETMKMPVTTTTTHPRVVRPQTLAADPGVQIMLLPRSMSSGDDEEDGDNKEWDEDRSETTESNKACTNESFRIMKCCPNGSSEAAISSSPPGSGDSLVKDIVAAIFPEPSSGGESQGRPMATNTKNTVNISEQWIDSRQPSRYLPQESNSSLLDPPVPTISSSLSTTTPALNSIEGKYRRAIANDDPALSNPGTTQTQPILDDLRTEQQCQGNSAARQLFPRLTGNIVRDSRRPASPPMKEVRWYPHLNPSPKTSISSGIPSRNSQSSTTGCVPNAWVGHRQDEYCPCRQTKVDCPVLGIRAPIVENCSDYDYEGEVLDFEYPKHRLLEETELDLL